MKYFLLVLILGFFSSHIFPFAIEKIDFTFLAIILLVIGLYASVYEIDITVLKDHKRLVFSALTFGVIFKGIFIGMIVFLFTRNIFSFLLGIIVAQIDPLSVTHLLKSKDSSFSSIGRTILRVWSSFDNPMTILLSIFFVGPLVIGTFYTNPFSYIWELFLNIAFALFVYICSKYASTDFLKKVILILCLIISIIGNLTLGIALIALFLRPKLGKYLSHIVTLAFYMGVFLLGLTFKLNSQAILYGVVLGIAGFGAQIIATFLIAKNLTKIDRLHLAFSQYNGITSIGLGIFYANHFPTITSIIAIAVVSINTIYYTMNNFIFEKLQSH